MTNPHMHAALDRMLAIDEKRQIEDREPQTELEVKAHNIIVSLSRDFPDRK